MITTNRGGKRPITQIERLRRHYVAVIIVSGVQATAAFTVAYITSWGWLSTLGTFWTVVAVVAYIVALALETRNRRVQSRR